MEHIINELVAFKLERNWQKHHTDSELARSLMIEAAELNRLFQWPLNKREKDHDEKVGEELADVFIYALYLCEQYGFDVEGIILDKIKKNAKKYPV